jgi:hypothetical protein
VDPPSPPESQRVGGAVAVFIFHFVGGWRAVFTMIFAMFSARLLQHFYKVFCKAFYNIFTRSFARLLEHVYKVFCKAKAS